MERHGRVGIYQRSDRMFPCLKPQSSIHSREVEGQESVRRKCHSIADYDHLYNRIRNRGRRRPGPNLRNDRRLGCRNLHHYPVNCQLGVLGSHACNLHIHVFDSIVKAHAPCHGTTECILLDTQPMAKMRPLQVDENGTAVSLDDLDLETFGAAQYTQLSWRSLIDGWACTSCARCQDVCPAYASGKALNPMQIIHDVRAYANEHSELLFKGESPEEDMITRFGEAAIWACTTCNACVDVCPVNIEHVPKLTDARRHLMMERMEFDESVEDTVMPLMMTIENLESDSNPYGIPMHEKAIGLLTWMSRLQNQLNTSTSQDALLLSMNVTRRLQEIQYQS